MSLFFTIAILQFLALVAPGPDFAMVVKNATLYTRRLALYTAFGISLGIIVHVSYCILGFAIIIAKSTFVFNIIKYLGAAYLIYIGIKSLLTKTAASTSVGVSVADNSISALQAVKQGFFCNALNPKASLFFLGLFTLVIKPGVPIGLQIFYGGWMVMTTFVWFAFLSLMITHPQVRNKILHLQPIVSKVMGVLLILFAVKLMFI